MADAEWKKAELWADTGDREDPEDVGIDRSVGWPVSYEQRGSGDEPERTVFQQLLREMSAGGRSISSAWACCSGMRKWTTRMPRS